MKVTVTGFIQQNEKRFKKEATMAAPIQDIKIETKDVRVVLQHPLYKRFVKKLDQVEDVDRDSVARVVLEVMSGIIAGGGQTS